MNLSNSATCGQCSRADRLRLLNAVTQFGFALSEITLFLDTHPEDPDALDYYRQMNRMYHKVSAEYEDKYGSLTQFCGQDGTIWKWASQPWPWERGFY